MTEKFTREKPINVQPRLDDRIGDYGFQQQVNNLENFLSTASEEQIKKLKSGGLSLQDVLSGRVQVQEEYTEEQKRALGRILLDKPRE